MRPLLRLAALSALLLNSCYPPGDGKAPPLDELYFPTGVALDRFTKSEVEPGAPKFLYVANSDFDLQYRAASVISYDLDLLRQVVPRNCNKTADCQRDGGDDFCDADPARPADPARGPSYYCVKQSDHPEPCGEFGNHDDADLVLTPGRCNYVNPITPQDGTPSLKVHTVGIGAFATDVLWRKNPEPDPHPGVINDEWFPARLFIPVRGDSTLHWIDVDQSGHFHCGQEDGDNDDGCNDKHRSGDTTWDNYDQLRQPPEPFALDASPDGKFIVVTNQTSGSVSLFANDWTPNGGPMLADILGGLPLAPVGIAAVPQSVLGDGTTEESAFLVTYRTAARIDLLRVRTELPPVNSSYTRNILSLAGSVPINAVSLGFDSRGIAIDDTELAACATKFAQCGNGAQCIADRIACQAAARLPEVFVASRAPASLLVGAMTADVNAPAGTSWLPSFGPPFQLTFGPSRVIAGQIKVPGTASSAQSDQAGPYELERRIFVVCFDSRRIFVYNPKRRLMEAIVSTGRGPFALAVDEVRGLAYLGHFTDSYLGVISLDQRFPQTYATIVASIGAPKAPRTSK